jgi:hypothetical protein
MPHNQRVLQTPNTAPFIERRIAPNYFNSDLTDREAELARRESVLRALTCQLFQSQESERLRIKKIIISKTAESHRRNFLCRKGQRRC